METLFERILSAENLRTLVTLVGVACIAVWLKGKIDKGFADVDQRFAEVDAKMDKRFAEFNAEMDRRFAEVDKRFIALEAGLDKRFLESEAKTLAEVDALTNRKLSGLYHRLQRVDLARVADTIRALTFTLSKNGFVTKDDEAFVTNRLPAPPVIQRRARPAADAG